MSHSQNKKNKIKLTENQKDILKKMQEGWILSSIDWAKVQSFTIRPYIDVPNALALDKNDVRKLFDCNLIEATTTSRFHRIYKILPRGREAI